MSNHHLRTLRKIQTLTSSFVCCLFDRHALKLIIMQTTFLLISLTCFIIYHFYAQERYNLYGCRKDYEYGFPYICPKQRRPFGIDITCWICIMCSISFLLLSIFTPVIYTLTHWKRMWMDLMLNTIKHSAEKKYDIEDADIQRCQSLLLKLEGFEFDVGDIGVHWDEYQSANHSLLLKFSSAIYSSLYLSLLYNNKKYMFCLLLGLLLLNVAFPVSVVFMSTSTEAFFLIFALCCFHFLPIHSFCVIVFCVLSISSNISFVYPILFISFWFIYNILIQVAFCCFERNSEWDLMREKYDRFLATYMTHLNRNVDVDICLALMGHANGKKIDNITFKDFVNRINVDRNGKCTDRKCTRYKVDADACSRISFR